MVPLIQQAVADNPTMTAAVAARTLAPLVFAEVSQKQARSTLKLALDRVRGHGYKSYWRLQAWAEEMMKLDNDTTVTVDTERCADGSDAYKAVFVCLGAAKRAALHLRPCYQIDATWAQHQHFGAVFLLVGQDANNHSVLLCYGHAGNESAATWKWFLQQSKEALGTNPGGHWDILDNDKVVMLSDRDKGLWKAVSTQLSQAHHFRCLKHLQRNVKGTFGAKKSKRYMPAVKGMMYALTEGQFNQNRDALREEPLGEQIWQYLTTGNPPAPEAGGSQRAPRMPASDCSLMHWVAWRVPDGRRLFGTYTTNNAEGLNQVLKEARRRMPLQAMMYIAQWMRDQFNKGRARFQTFLGQPRTARLPPVVVKRCHRSSRKAQNKLTMPVQNIVDTAAAASGDVQSESLFPTTRHVTLPKTVEEPTCSCNVYKQYGVPCSHMWKLATVMGIDPYTLVVPELTTPVSLAAYDAATPVLITLNVATLEQRPLGTPGVRPPKGKPQGSRFASFGEDYRRMRGGKEWTCGRCQVKSTDMVHPHYSTTCTCKLPPVSALTRAGAPAAWEALAPGALGAGGAGAARGTRARGGDAAAAAAAAGGAGDTAAARAAAAAPGAAAEGEGRRVRRRTEVQRAVAGAAAAAAAGAAGAAGAGAAAGAVRRSGRRTRGVRSSGNHGGGAGGGAGAAARGRVSRR